MAAIDAVGFAAARATDHEVEQLFRHVAAQEAALGDLAAFMDLDLRFARLLARATHNLALVLLANTIVRVISQQAGVELTFVVDPRGAVSTYRKMVELVASRDADAARSSARKLLERFDRALLAKVVAMTNGAKEHAPVHKAKTATKRNGRTNGAAARG
jgi:DNA-binding FadR family transcriptional regulator